MKKITKTIIFFASSTYGIIFSIAVIQVIKHSFNYA